ncbi:hypothetical protein [Niveispirillum fermenti]|uniref:hypothetical protein n=1 Tax=Niveispirillum fermenti TaxID=1233113 RepID=UPI003A8C7EA5
MIGVLGSLLSGRWLALVALSGLLLAGWSWHGRGRALEGARLEAALARETAARNAQAVEAMARRAGRDLAAVTAAAAAERERMHASMAIERRVENAPATHACADSAAVAAVLDGLRRRAGPAGDGNPAGTGDGAAGPAGLPAGTRAAAGRGG